VSRPYAFPLRVCLIAEHSPAYSSENRVTSRPFSQDSTSPFFSFFHKVSYVDAISADIFFFRRSMWLPPRFIRTLGRPFTPFACCVTLCVFTPPPLVFFPIIPLTLPQGPLGILWSVGRATCCLTPSPSLISSLWRLWFGPRRRPIFSTRSVARGFLFIGLANLAILRCGRGRQRVMMSWRSSSSLIPSRGSFHAGGWIVHIPRRRDGGR